MQSVWCAPAAPEHGVLLGAAGGCPRGWVALLPPSSCCPANCSTKWGAERPSAGCSEGWAACVCAVQPVPWAGCSLPATWQPCALCAAVLYVSGLPGRLAPFFSFNLEMQFPPPNTPFPVNNISLVRLQQKSQSSWVPVALSPGEPHPSQPRVCSRRPALAAG